MCVYFNDHEASLTKAFVAYLSRSLSSVCDADDFVSADCEGSDLLFTMLSSDCQDHIDAINSDLSVGSATNDALRQAGNGTVVADFLGLFPVVSLVATRFNRSGRSTSTTEEITKNLRKYMILIIVLGCLAQGRKRAMWLLTSLSLERGSFPR